MNGHSIQLPACRKKLHLPRSTTTGTLKRSMQSSSEQLPDHLATLFTHAQAAAAHAYAPYSGFSVGAALLFDDGTTTTGCNVENASYGLTSCAERNALFRAISEHGNSRRIIAIAVANLNKAPSPPCGACRQVLSEFVAADALVIFPDEGGIAGAPIPFRDLFPHSFHMAPASPAPSKPAF